MNEFQVQMFSPSNLLKFLLHMWDSNHYTKQTNKPTKQQQQQNKKQKSPNKLKPSKDPLLGSLGSDGI